MKCQSCGAESDGARARCEYCDAPLQGVRALEVQWTARGRDGVAGRGRVSVAAPPDLSAEQLRAKAEAAFAAALDAAGAGASVDQVSASMRERIAAMLGREVQLQACEVQALTAGPLPGQAPGGRPAAPASSNIACRVFAALLLISIAACSGFCGLGGWIAGTESAALAARARQAQVLKVPEARQAQGLVVVESHRPEVDAPLLVGEVPCLKIDRPRDPKQLDRAPGFRLNRLEVLIDPDTRFDPLREVGKEGARAINGFRADQDVTVMGEVRDGVLRAELVSALSGREKLVAKLDGDASTGRFMGLALPAVALAAMLAGVLVLKGGSRRSAPA